MRWRQRQAAEHSVALAVVGNKTTGPEDVVANARTGPGGRVVHGDGGVDPGMELGIAESAVTIRALSVNGKRMWKGIYSQSPRRPLPADDCTVDGRPWGHVVGLGASVQRLTPRY
ncbi:hypothetical protein ACH4E7_21425 [Kitasatospora sp. NPDC018058]|uniref:hypothetical protein n=1 Tax=Kitasatospora sp. NPDC018058 TaxID=3364025 RepID=UPI0037C0F9D1